ncbi:WXG100-like domain-containing protein [Kitasatospora sp. NPDC004531]
MIVLPADLAEVLKTVQKNENGKDIAFPDANEELLAELAAAWDEWNRIADTHVRAITEAAQRAMASMSGPAADSFQQYLQKFAGGEDSHVATTLQSGNAIATSLHGATGAVIDTKNEMVRELQYAKKYMEQNPAGKNDDIANSAGIKQAAAVYHQYVGQVVGEVDGKLRKNAGHLADMTGMAKSCALNGAGGNGSSGGAGGAEQMSGRSPAVMPAGVRVPGETGDGAGGPYGGAAAARPFSLPDAPGVGAGLPGGAGGGAGGAGAGVGSHGGVPGFGGVGGAGSAGGAGQSGGAPALTPFKLPTPNSPNLGSGGSGGGAPVFSPLGGAGAHPLNLAGLGDLGSGIGTELGSAPGAGPSGSRYSPLGNSGPGAGLSGSVGGTPFGGLGNLGRTGGYTGSSGASPRSAGGPAPFRGAGSNPFGGAGGSSARGGGGVGGAGSALRGAGAGGAGLGGAGGGSGIGARSARVGGGAGVGGGSGLGAAGGASARGMSGAAGAAGRVGSSGLGSGGGAAGGRAAGVGGAAGMGAGGPMAGMGGAGRGGGGGKDGKGGNRFLSPTRFGAEGEEEDELLHDAGILGQAGEVGPCDRNWHRARRRWLDDARADGTFTGPEPAAAPVAAGPSGEQEMLSQLAGVLLGTGAESSEVASSEADLTERQGDVAASGADDAYLERSRSVAARRGHGDVPESAAPGDAAPAAGAGGADEKPERAPLLQEEGFQVPSPFLRAALSRLATAPGASGASGGPAAG